MEMKQMANAMMLQLLHDIASKIGTRKNVMTALLSLWPGDDTRPKTWEEHIIMIELEGTDGKPSLILRARDPINSDPVMEVRDHKEGAVDQSDLMISIIDSTEVVRTCQLSRLI